MYGWYPIHSFDLFISDYHYPCRRVTHNIQVPCRSKAMLTAVCTTKVDGDH